MSQTDPRAAIARFVERAYAALDQVDYYRVLGVSSAATESQIRDAYYRLATRLHPDVHGEGVEPTYRVKLTTVFSRVVEAYKVLSDAEKRRQYDRELARGSMRLQAGAKPRRSAPEDAIRDPKAKRFYELGLAAILDNNQASAVMNLKLALSMEPGSELIKQKLEEAERMSKR